MSVEAKIASKTYRKTVKIIKERYALEVGHGPHPSRDLEAALEEVDEKHRTPLKETLIRFYKLGAVRGLKVAPDKMMDGEFSVEDGTLWCPEGGVDLKLKVKPAGDEEWTSVHFRVTPRGNGIQMTKAPQVRGFSLCARRWRRWGRCYRPRHLHDECQDTKERHFAAGGIVNGQQPLPVLVNHPRERTVVPNLSDRLVVLAHASHPRITAGSPPRVFADDSAQQVSGLRAQAVTHARPTEHSPLFALFRRRDARDEFVHAHGRSVIGRRNRRHAEEED